jgi:hypothetical protein
MKLYPKQYQEKIGTKDNNQLQLTYEVEMMIKNEQELIAVLERIERLWGKLSEAGSIDNLRKLSEKVRMLESSRPDICEQLGSHFGYLFTEEQQNKLFPKLISWSGCNVLAIHWFERYKIPSCGNLTPLELCQTGQVAILLEYVEFIENGGFE